MVMVEATAPPPATPATTAATSTQHRLFGRCARRDGHITRGLSARATPTSQDRVPHRRVVQREDQGLGVSRPVELPPSAHRDELSPRLRLLLASHAHGRSDIRGQLATFEMLRFP